VDEKMKILTMLEEGILSAEEAMTLMNTLTEQEDESVEVTIDSEIMKGRKIRIKVFDPSENKNFDIKVPIALVKLALRIAGMFSKDLKQRVGDQKIEELARMAIDEIRSSGPQTLVDIEDGDGTIVKISVL
jgi:hypothetical protein